MVVIEMVADVVVVTEKTRAEGETCALGTHFFPWMARAAYTVPTRHSEERDGGKHTRRQIGETKNDNPRALGLRIAIRRNGQ